MPSSYASKWEASYELEGNFVAGASGNTGSMHKNYTCLHPNHYAYNSNPSDTYAPFYHAAYLDADLHVDPGSHPYAPQYFNTLTRSWWLAYFSRRIQRREAGGPPNLRPAGQTSQPGQHGI